jgi:flavin reductase (DIM6/NTAB) family NADH-FMN oxidoreductase RutF
MSNAIHSAAFREALAHFASGVTIVTAHGSEGLVGFTATGFTSVSLSPPLILVCVNKTASAYDGVIGASHFAVSVLGEDQRWLAERFATSGIDRFQGVTLHPGIAFQGGALSLPAPAPQALPLPLISGALAHIECRPHARHDAGDHTLLVGEVLCASTSTGRPLLHFARNFGALAAPAVMPGRSPRVA